MVYRTLTVLTLRTLMTLTPAAALTDDESEPAEPQWRFQTQAGSLPGNPGSGIEESLRAAGFEDNTRGGCSLICSDVTRHPSTDKKAFPWGIETGYRLRSWPRLSGAMVKTTIGTTVGSQRDKRLQAFVRSSSGL
jgi:hypothetical protein